MTQPIKVRNPRNGENDYEITPWSAEQISALAAAQRQAQRHWNVSGLEHRLAVMQRWKEHLIAHREAIIHALTTDTGRHLISVGEADSLAPRIDSWCRLAPAIMQESEAQAAAMPSVRLKSQLVPYSLVGVISPWNFPVTLALIDAIPALIAGCSVIIKPSEITPRFAEPLRQTIAAVPELAAVLSVIDGAGTTGAALINAVDVVCFTGSVKTGRSVAEAAARNFIPAFLELGGKDPVIVTASADLEAATDTILRASVVNTGQACQSLERIYVHESIADEFTAKLTEKAKAARLNYPDIHSGHIGPLIFDKQAEVIAEQITDAVIKGARILYGGVIETHGGGKWIRPTVMTNVTHDMKIMTEETFGPVMPVMTYRTPDEAIALANDTEFGLSAAVFAGSLDEAEAIGRQINAGGISLNDGSLTSMIHDAEKHSFKCSGMGGSRMGAAGMQRFFRKKALFVQTGTPRPLADVAEENLKVK